MTALVRRLLDAPSGWQQLDPVAATGKQVVDRVLSGGRAADLLHGRGIGHPSHPPLAQAALSGWTGAAVLGVLALTRPDDPGSHRPVAGDARGVLGAVGLASAGPAVLAGLADWADLHEDQQRTGLVHAAVMSVAALASGAARLTRQRRRSAALDVAAGVVATLGAALGGHLAYRWSAGPNHAEAFPHLAKEGWVRVCAIDDVVEGRLRPATVGDEPIVVGRVGGELFALADRCSHLAGPLSEGELRAVDGRVCVVCPWHDSAFDVTDGEVHAGPAYAPQPVLDVRTAYGWVDVRARQLPGVSGR